MQPSKSAILQRAVFDLRETARALDTMSRPPEQPHICDYHCADFVPTDMPGPKIFQVTHVEILQELGRRWEDGVPLGTLLLDLASGEAGFRHITDARWLELLSE